MLLENNRLGNTVITSVSVSKEFKKLIEENGISATNALRKGIAVELFEKGIIKYDTEINKIRKEKTEEFFKFMEEIEKFNERKDNFISILQKISNNTNILLEDIKKLNKSENIK